MNSFELDVTGIIKSCYKAVAWEKINNSCELNGIVNGDCQNKTVFMLGQGLICIHLIGH